MPALQLKNISKDYGKHAILRDINIEVAQKEFLILVGPSGCGKSTLLNMIAGLEETPHGQILMNGEDVTKKPPKDRDVSMVFQSYALYPNMTVRENISFGLKMRKMPKQKIAEKVSEVSGILQLDALLDRTPSQLSGGQRQRVAMGRAIARSPHLYLFDEPLSNLDAQLRSVMRKEIKKLHARIQCAVVYVTHDQQEAMTLGDRIAVMNQGRLIQLGTPDEIYASPNDMFVAGFIGSPAMNFIPTRLQKKEDIVSFDLAHSNKTKNLAAPSFLHASTSQEIILGVRPEHIEVSKTATEKTMDVRVSLVENTGSDVFVYFPLNGQEVVARTKHMEVSEEDIIHVSLQLDRCSFFDKATEKRISP